MDVLKDEAQKFLDTFEKFVKKTEKKFTPGRSFRKILGNKQKTTIPEITSEALYSKVPSKDMTGVDPYITRLCATISGQMYDADLSKKSWRFNFSCDKFPNKNPEMVLLETHGIYEITNPPFSVVVVDQTMILAWRGSYTAMDWDRDLGFYIASCSRWKEVASTVKVQGAYLTMIENCMSVHEDKIIEAIKEHNITELVCTGHSLGGGAAQVAHIYFQGSMSASGDATNVWKQLKDKLTVRTISFEGPMTTVFIKSKHFEENEKGMSFLKRCGDNMCTTAFQQDVVPRAYGMAGYGFALIGNMMDEFAEAHARGLVDRIEDHPILDFAVKKITMHKLHDDFKGVSRVMNSFRHLGNVIWYENYDSEPKVYADYGPDDDMKKNIRREVPNFRKVEYKQIEGLSIAKQGYNDHMFIVKAPGLGLNVLPITGLKTADSKIL